jgi:hypothetical protein
MYVPCQGSAREKVFFSFICPETDEQREGKAVEK